MHAGQSIKLHMLGIFLSIIYPAITMEAAPIANSVAWVLVAEETKNYWAIARPATIMFEISLLE